MRREIWREPGQPEVQQKPVLHLLLEGALGRDRRIAGRWPHSHPKQHTEAELKLIWSIRRRNPSLGLIELWHRLRLRGYARRPESLFRVMRKLGMFPQKDKKKDHVSKPYQHMTYPSQRIQVDVKVVPR